MKFYLIIFVFFLSVAQAQNKQVRIKTLEIVDPELQSFIQDSKKINFIEFDTNSYGNLRIKPDTALLYKGSFPLVYSGSYYLNFKGHQFLFTEQFGAFPLTRLQKILDSIRIKNKGWVTYEGSITKDYLHIKVTNTYYKK